MKCPKCRSENSFAWCTCGTYLCEGTTAMGHRRQCGSCGTPNPPDPPAAHDPEDPNCDCHACLISSTHAMERW